MADSRGDGNTNQPHNRPEHMRTVETDQGVEGRPVRPAGYGETVVNESRPLRPLHHQEDNAEGGRQHQPAEKVTRCAVGWLRRMVSSEWM